MRCIWATFFLFCLLSPGLRAQQYNFRTWSLESGLPQSEVTCLEQGGRGFIWAGTMGGLSAFDGLHFKNYTKKNGLSSNNISCLFKPKNDFLWVGTFTHGLCQFNGTSFNAYGEKNGLPAGGVYSITETPDGKLWAATDKGLAYFENGRFVMLPASSGVPPIRFWTIMADRDGVLWLGTLGNGLYRYDGRRTQHFSLEDGLSNKIVYSLYQTRNGTIWIGTYGGLTKFDGKKFTPLFPGKDQNLNRSVSMSEDADGKLWIAQDGGGLLRYDGRNFERITIDNGLATNYLHALKHDREGNLWIGTVSSGLQRLTPSSFTYYTRQEGLQNQNIRALNRDKQGNLWVGTFDGGAGICKTNKFQWFTQADGLPSNIVNSICNDAKGNVWLGTNRGISCYNGSGFRNYDYNDGLIFNIVNYLLPDSNNSLWIATNEGFSHFDGRNFKNYRIPGNSSNNFILCLLKDRQNRLWLGTKSGVFQFRNGQFIRPKNLSSLDVHEVNAMVQDFKGNIWFTTYDHGVVLYEPARDRIKVFTEKQGLLTEAVNSLRIDSLSRLWIGGIKGLNQLDLRAFYQDPETRPKAYSYSDGFRGIEVNPNAILADKGGKMWFGTVNGLVKYLPENDKANAFDPELSIIEVRLNSQPLNWEAHGLKKDAAKLLPENLELERDENHLTFEYRGIYLTNPEQVQYIVKLEGVDKKWSEPTTNTSAVYSNLPPGNYIFKVKACLADGECDPKVASYKFAIKPPFWSKDRIVGITILVLASLVFGFVRWRENNLIKLNTLLEENVEQRTRMLERKNQEKEVLLKEVHHRVKNNLQIITSLLNLQARHISDPAALNTLREIKDRIKSISMLHQRLYQREELSCIDLSEYVQTLCRSLFASYGVREDHVRLEFDIPSLYLDIDTALTLGLIVNELVSNTLKYAFPEQRKGTLLIELLRVTETEYTLTISDDGTGLPDNFEEKMATSFGLQLVSSLIKKLHGSLKFYSQGGTQIRLQFVILPQ